MLDNLGSQAAGNVGLVDKLTPNGSVPEHSNLVEMASNMIKNLGTRAS